MTHAPRRTVRRHSLHPLALWHSLRMRPRVWGAALTGFAVLGLLPEGLSLSVRATLAWISAASIYLVFAANEMRGCDSDMMVARAARQDDSRFVILGILVLASVVNMVSIAGVMAEAKTLTGEARGWHIILAAATIAMSWIVMQVIFAIHYAHEYYRPDDHSGQRLHGLAFPDEATPDYWDFLYFSTSIGATSQTSDVSVRSRAMRRLVTAHAVVSFFYNSAVLALTINLAAGMI